MAALLLCILFAAGVTMLEKQRERFTVDFVKPVMPARLGQWTFRKEIPITDEVLAILGTKGAVLAEYENPSGEAVEVYVLRGSSKRSSIHQPEYCYLADERNELLEKINVRVTRDGREFPLTFMKIKSGDVFQAIAYFYTANDLITNSYARQQLFFLRCRLQGRPVEGSLIRISKFSKELDNNHDISVLQDVSFQIVSELNAL